MAEGGSGEQFGALYKVLQRAIGRCASHRPGARTSGLPDAACPRRALWEEVSEQHQGPECAGGGRWKDSLCEMFTLGMRCGRDWEEKLPRIN